MDLLQLPHTALQQLASLLARGDGTELRTLCRAGRQLANRAVTAAQVCAVGACTFQLPSCIACSYILPSDAMLLFNCMITALRRWLMTSRTGFLRWRLPFPT